MRIDFTALVILGLYVNISCTESKDATHDDSLNTPQEYARDIIIEYRDSTNLQVVINAPLLERMQVDKAPVTYFNEGVKVHFYNERGSVQSWLTADKATQYPKDGKIIARDNVFLYNIQGDTLITSEIIWDEKTSEVRTSKFVKIKRPNQEVINSYGFKADQKFTNFTLYAVEGNVEVKDLDI